MKIEDACPTCGALCEVDLGAEEGEYVAIEQETKSALTPSASSVPSAQYTQGWQDCLGMHVAPTQGADARPVASDAHAFALMCDALPVDFNWGDPLTPDGFRHIESVLVIRATPAEIDGDARNQIIEQCAKVCDGGLDQVYANGWVDCANERKRCAAAIRALANGTGETR
jgi:hypothetical protein